MQGVSSCPLQLRESRSWLFHPVDREPYGGYFHGIADEWEKRPHYFTCIPGEGLPGPPASGTRGPIIEPTSRPPSPVQW
jgi:hypothetical protein